MTVVFPRCGGLEVHKKQVSASLYSRLVRRKGENRARVAVAHSILVAACRMLKTNPPYQDPGPDCLDRRRPRQTLHRLVQGLAQLAYKADLASLEAAQAAS